MNRISGRVLRFTHWLRNHEDDADAVGELSRDFAADLRRIRRGGGRFPKTPLDILGRLLSSRAWSASLKTLTHAVEEWHRENEAELRQLESVGWGQDNSEAREAARTLMADCERQSGAYRSAIRLVEAHCDESRDAR